MRAYWSSRRLMHAALLVLLACGEPTSPRTPTAIVIVPSEPRVVAHGVVQLTATVTDAAGEVIEGAPLAFASSDEAIVTVSATGLVTSVGPLGQSRVTVESSPLMAAVDVMVVLPPSAVMVEPASLTLQPGEERQLVVTVTDDQGRPTDAQVSYVSSDPSVATVSEVGSVRGEENGTAIITVSSGDLVSVEVPVDVAQIPTTLIVTPNSLALAPGFTEVLSVVLLDAQGAPILDPEVTLTTSNAAVATVAASGLVRAVSNGSVVITVECRGLVEMVDVVVGGTPPGAILATTRLHGAPWGVRARGDRFYVTVMEDTVGTLYIGQGSAFTFPVAIPVGALPLDVDVNQAGTRAYVAGASHGTVVGGTGVVDLTTNTLVDAIAGAQNSPRLAVALSADESRLFVGTQTGLEIITLATRQAVVVPGINGTLNAFTRHPAQPLLYATVNGQAVLELDAVTGAVLRSFDMNAFPLDGSPQGSAVAPDGTLLYFLDENRGTLRVWDLVANTPSATIEGVGGFGLAVSPDGQLLYAASGAGVILVDRATLVPLRTVTVNGNARRIAFRADGVAVVTNEYGRVDFLR